MKRSEVLEILDYYLDSKAITAAIVAGMEKKGQKWDPEEEPLPEELELGEYPSSSLLLWPKGRRTVTHGTRRRYYREAVRRWNSWREIRAHVDRLGDDGPSGHWLRPVDAERRRRLLELLDDKEGE